MARLCIKWGTELCILCIDGALLAHSARLTRLESTHNHTASPGFGLVGGFGVVGMAILIAMISVNLLAAHILTASC